MKGDYKSPFFMAASRWSALDLPTRSMRSRSLDSLIRLMLPNSRSKTSLVFGPMPAIVSKDDLIDDLLLLFL